uniref:AIG1-type G domain-containing protein n=1 Tax=Erpetoichthys calabaricus TaxID=27687 RepID=A0A8C4XCF5_ERPCA
MLAGFKVVSSASQFDSEILDPEAEHVVCFMVTSLKEKEPYLLDMSSYLDSLSNGTPMSLHNLKLSEENLNQDGNCRRVRFGYASNKGNRTIMMIGATGAGKTTLINGMINYILGVEWTDNFRFVLIDEQTQKSQAESQTSAVTAYEINHMEGFGVPYSLTIVDTPGFGDTRGIKHDQRITGLIRDFFSQPGGIDHIDAICFVTQASLARLTHTQRYVFDSILSIFGKDIADNIVMLVTFADGQSPPVLEAIKASQIPCSVNGNGEPTYFKFNNSALFVDNSRPKGANKNEFESDDFDHMFWKMGSYSLGQFFKSLPSFSPKSLVLTQEVLKERQELEVAIEGLQPQINAGLTKIDEIKKIKYALEQHKAEMEANKDFEYEIDVTNPVQELNTSGMYLTNCQNCNFTCHDSCIYANDKDKDKCSAMDKKGYCKVCPGNCVWNVHFNQKYKWTYVTTKEKRTYNELKQRFEEAHGEVMTTKNIFEQLEIEFSVVQEIVFELIQKSHHCLEKLKVIALRPNPLSAPDYIDLMIESEKRECKPGFQDRIQSLMEVRQKAEIVSKMSSGDLLPEEWAQYGSRYSSRKVKGKGVFGTVKDWLCSAFKGPLGDMKQYGYPSML